MNGMGYLRRILMDSDRLSICSDQAGGAKVRPKRGHFVVLYFVAFIPSIANDIVYAFAYSSVQFLTIDYVSHFFVLLVFLMSQDLRQFLWRIVSPEFNWPKAAILAIAAFAFEGAVGPAISMYARDVLGTWHYYGRFPPPRGALLVFDNFVGLPFAAFTEELLSRALFYRVFRSIVKSTTALVLMSAVMFAAMHWGAGAPAVANAFVSGIVMMVLFLKTGSVVPGTIVHYLSNLIFFE